MSEPQSFKQIAQKIHNNYTAEQLGVNKFKPADSCSPPQVDVLLEDCNDLINPSFKSWYAKTFAAMPMHRVYELASQAREGKVPARYFSFLLKR